MSDYMSMSPSAFSNQIMFGDNASLRNMPGPAPQMTVGGDANAFFQSNLAHNRDAMNYSSAVNALNSQRSMEEGARLWADSRATNARASELAQRAMAYNTAVGRRQPVGYYSPGSGRSSFSGVSLSPQYSGGGIGSDMRYGNQNRLFSGGFPAGNVWRGSDLPDISPAYNPFIHPSVSAAPRSPFTGMSFGGNQASLAHLLRGAASPQAPDLRLGFGKSDRSPLYPSLNLADRWGSMQSPAGGRGGIGSDAFRGGQGGMFGGRQLPAWYSGGGIGSDAARAPAAAIAAGVGPRPPALPQDWQRTFTDMVSGGRGRPNPLGDSGWYPSQRTPYSGGGIGSDAFRGGQGGMTGGGRADLAALMNDAQNRMRAGKGWTIAEQPPAASQGYLANRINQSMFDVGNAGDYFSRMIGGGFRPGGQGLTPQDLAIPHAYPPSVRR